MSSPLRITGMTTDQHSGQYRDHQALLKTLEDCLIVAGMDILHPFPVQLFNAESPAEHQLPTFARDTTLAVVIGNSNRLWRPFLQALARKGLASLNNENPLDAYVEQQVSRAVQQAVKSYSSTTTSKQNASPMHYEIRFSHHTEPDKFVNMLRAAQLSGLAYYSSVTHLCMHPVFGPWFALRAVAVFDCDGPNPSNFIELPCPHPDLEAEAATAMKQLEAKGGLSNWQQHWREWAQLRSLGGKYTDPSYCYSDDQLEYHYTKSKDVLTRAVNKFQEQQLKEQQQLQRDH